MAQNRNPRLKLSAILDFRKFDFWPMGLTRQFISICAPKWCKNVDRRPNYGPKSKFKTAAVRHLGFSKIWFLTNGLLSIFHHGTKFGAKLLIDAQITAQNRNSRWRPSAILKFLYHHIGPPTKSFWLHQPVKFCANPMHSFEDMGFDFLQNCLTCLFTPQKFRFLWGLDPKIKIIVKTPKRHICTCYEH